MSRPKGLPKTGGRKKGSKDKLTQEAKGLARALLVPRYLANLETRMIEGKAGPIEPKVWEYAFGKPVDTQRVEGELIISWGGTRRGDDGDD